jgi:hypothetical protein
MTSTSIVRALSRERTPAAHWLRFMHQLVTFHKIAQMTSQRLPKTILFDGKSSTVIRYCKWW